MSKELSDFDKEVEKIFRTGKFQQFVLRPIRTFFSNLRRLYLWLPVIWKDRDWDYDYLLIIMKFKMSMMQNDILKRNIIEDAKKVSDELKHAQHLIENPDEDDYCHLNYDKLFDFMKEKIYNWWD